MKDKLDTQFTPIKNIDLDDLSVFGSAVEQYFGYNEWGYRLYKKFADDRWGSGCGNRRLMRFMSLINSIQTSGYDNDYQITNTDVLMKMHSTFYQAGSSVDIYHNRVVLSPEMKIINGRHRVAVCIYMGVSMIPCVINTDESKISSVEYEHVFSHTDKQLLIECLDRMKSRVRSI